MSRNSVTKRALFKAAVARVGVVGSSAPLAFKQDSTGLHITLPPSASHDYGVALKIPGNGLG